MIISRKRLVTNLNSHRAKILSNKYCINKGFKRIYLYHIRKTGGTSLTESFLALRAVDRVRSYYQLAGALDNRIIIKDLVYVGWNTSLLEKGDYFFGFSHNPSHQIKLPNKTFTITIIRDPVRRLISYYQMLLTWKKENSQHPEFKRRGEWLGENFRDFLQNISDEYLLAQLYMFSRKYKVSEAYRNIIDCSSFYFTENFNKGVADLSMELALKLKPIHAAKSVVKASINKKDLKMLEQLLEPEIGLYKKLKKYKLKSK
jgi:hypothetical protein